MEKITYRYATLVSLAICALLAYDRVAWNSVDGATLAGWAQAIGSVAAIVVAMWLATREDRRRSSEAMSLAVVTGAALIFRLTVASGLASKPLTSFARMARFDGPASTFKTAHEQLAAIDIGTLSEVNALIPLPNHAAYKLAGAQDRLQAVRHMLKRVSENDEFLQDSEHRKQQAETFHWMLSELRDLLGEVHKECERASHGHVASGWPFKAE